MHSEAAPSPAPRAPGDSTAPAPAPIATGNQHVCFICLLNDAETPGERWVNPCPCTLEAHEDCMLRWVAETEQSRTVQPRGGGGGLRCPACQARIRVDEPYDPVVQLRDRLHRAYSRVSPVILMVLVTSGGIAGSGWYGLTATQVFAGYDATARWLGLQSLAGPRPGDLWRWVPFWKLNAKIWALSMIGPALTISRLLQPLGNLVIVPSSLLSSIILVSKDDMPTWPPSPAWAMTIFPFVQMTYNSIYYEFLGSFEKGLNRALQGRSAEELPERPGQDAAAGEPGQPAEQPEGPQQEGLVAALWGLGEAAVGLFGGDDEVVVEAEVRLGGNAVLDEDDEAEIEAELVELEREAMADAAVQEHPDARAPAVAGDGLHGAGQGGAAAQEGQLGDRPPDGAPNQPRDDPEPQPPAEDNNRVNTTLSDIVNNIVTSLLLPSICFGMGELLRVSLPRRWVTRPFWSRPTGLLQERWGRSLVGGCLYVVLRDTLTLYTKYRRVQVKQGRKIRNVDRRR